MKLFKWLNLQLFAGEGAGEGGAEGAATGENAVDAGQQRLRELGVPEDKIRKRAQRSAPKLPAGAVSSAPPQPEQTQEPVAAADPEPTTEEPENNTPKRMSWEEIMADPEYNKQMQSVVQGRIRGAKAAEEAMGKLAPALELLARKHGMDPAKIDYEALSKVISDDRSYYEDKALEMGVPVETAMKLDQEQRDTARQQRQQEETIREERNRKHFEGLMRQAEEMKAMYPNFDLQKELQNPAFFRMTAPDVNIPIKMAYQAVHGEEIMTTGMQVAAQKTAQQISNSIQAGGRRPMEAGTTAQAPSVTTFDYRKASPEQRKAMKDYILSEAAHGRKVYPGGFSGK
jgi:hypothetical protein